MAWSLDRLGRSMNDLVMLLADLEKINIDLYVKQQVIDTTTPSGKLVFHVAGAFAEFEREMIRERVNAGLARARAQGKVLGRPKLIDDSVIAKVKEDRQQGLSLRAIQKKHKISLGAVHKIAKPNKLTKSE
tara:strand:- start:2935 stop:3327 length:393 start_codon:yes stop_codon:yes gene_type:complete